MMSEMYDFFNKNRKSVYVRLLQVSKFAASQGFHFLRGLLHLKCMSCVRSLFRSTSQRVSERSRRPNCSSARVPRLWGRGRAQLLAFLPTGWTRRRILGTLQVLNFDVTWRLVEMMLTFLPCKVSSNLSSRRAPPPGGGGARLRATCCQERL